MQGSNNLQINQLVHDLRNRLNNIVINGELARLLLEKGRPQQEILAKIDKIVGDTRATANMVQEWYDQADI